MPKPDQTIGDLTAELIDKNNKKQNDNAEIVTYRFAVSEEAMPRVPPVIPRIRHILPSLCACLTCIPFGLMLGWPSPTNPILLEKDSPIPITIDQSAMIAGFLMIGNAVGTPLSNKSFLTNKYGILSGIIVMTIGWALMWKSRSIFWLLGSRLLVGLGNAYSTGQLKLYISNTCDKDLKVILIKLINMYVYLGVVIMFCIGPFMDFRNTSLVCLIISITTFLILLFLPTDLIQSKKMNVANKICNEKDNGGFINIFKDEKLRIIFFKFIFLVFCQQFSGAPSTIIYTQILLKESQCFNPEYLAIVYVIIFFTSNIVGIFVTPRFNKRKVLLLSTLSVIVTLTILILVINFDVNNTYWRYSSFLVLCLYIVAHTIGLGNIPFTLIPDLFPSSFHTSIVHFFIAFHSILALIITKIFQVLMSQYNVVVPFYLFLCISACGLSLIYFYLPKGPVKDECNNVKIVEMKVKTIV